MASETKVFTQFNVKKDKLIFEILRIKSVTYRKLKNNEWYPRGLQISLHIRSPGLQDYSEVWNLKFYRFWGGGGILKLSDLDSLTIFILGWLGGILKLSDLDSLTIFIWGVFWNSWIWTLWQFSFWGGYCKTLGFGLWQISLEGYSETLGFGISDNFHFGGYSKTLGFGLADNFHFWWGYSETLGFGLSDNFHWGVFWNSQIWTLTIFMGGVFWNSQIWTLWQFSLGGGYSETLGFGLSDNFHLGGILKLLDLDSLTNFILGGVIWNSQIWTLWQFSFCGGVFWNSQIWTLTIFIWGGYSETLRFGLWQFSFGGGILKLSDLDSLTIFIGGGGILCYRIRVFWGIWTKISTTPAGSCITDSLSHTTYVEAK